jgi:hypothetical protein
MGSGMTINLKSMGTGQRLAKVGVQRLVMVCSHAVLAAVLLEGASTAWAQSEHYVTDAASADLLRVRQRLALEKTPEVRVTVEVPQKALSKPEPVKPEFGMLGGGIQRTATGDVPVRIKKVD